MEWFVNNNITKNESESMILLQDLLDNNYIMRYTSYTFHTHPSETFYKFLNASKKKIPKNTLPEISMVSVSMDSMDVKNQILDSNVLKPTKTITKKRACSICRAQHLKCSGESPCQQCLKKGTEDQCTFTAPQKRGPKSKELREIISNLREEITFQDQLLTEYEEKSGISRSDIIAAVRKKLEQ